MERIQIENVRSLKDTGAVSLSPITILVGTNSSGKSTFLRVFPLIKQSICKRTDGPLLWAGDVDDYVDFGSFAETVTNDGVSKCIRFSFSFSIPTDYTMQRRYGAHQRNDPEISKTQDVRYSIAIAQRETREYVSHLDVTLGSDRFAFAYLPRGSHTRNSFDSIMVNDVPVTISKDSTGRQNSNLLNIYGTGNARDSIFGFHLPSLRTCIDEFSNRIPSIKTNRMEDDESEERKYSRRQLAKVLLDIGMYLCHGAGLSAIVENNRISSKAASEMGSLDLAIDDVLNVLTNMEKEELEKALALLRLLYCYEQLPAMESFLNAYFRQVHYIAPLRATAERYYRLRNLAIDEVDYQGKNLAIFLNGLSPSRLTSFQNWTERFFGFKVMTKRSAGHLSVKILLQDQEVNLSDTGFGYSQILPIITQLWDLSSRKASRYNVYNLNGIFYSSDQVVPLVIAIEQPELHLHPSLQAKLAKALIASIRLAQDNGYRLQLLLETHSETIVNYFGRAIQRRELAEDEVSVVVFDKVPASKETTVRVSGYDRDGYLYQDTWPIGFFAAGD